MEDEVKNVETENTPTADDFMEQLNTLRATTVSKEEYDRVVADRNKLADSLINGSFKQDVAEEPKPDIDALRQKFLGPHKYNYEQIRDMLELRKACMDAGEDDPFAGNNPENLNTANLEEYERVAGILQECLDAMGDKPSDEMFMANLKIRCP